MPITFNCACGKTLRVDDGLAGKRARCPACQGVVPIPVPAPAADHGFEVVEDTAPPPPRRATPVAAKPAAKPPAPPPLPEAGFDVVDDEEDGKGYKAKRVDGRRLEEDADEDRRRRARRRRQKDQYDDEDEYDRAARRRAQATATGPSRSYESKVLNGGVVGGSIAMLIAVVWFVAGLAVGIIFYYPPFLFIIGLIGFVKGLMSRDDD